MLTERQQLVMIGLTKSQLEALPPNIMGMERTANVQELAMYYRIALYAHAQRTYEADKDGQYHRQHTAFIHVCHSLHLIYELLTWPWMVRRPSRMVTLSGWIPKGNPAKS